MSSLHRVLNCLSFLHLSTLMSFLRTEYTDDADSVQQCMTMNTDRTKPLVGLCREYAQFWLVPTPRRIHKLGTNAQRESKVNQLTQVYLKTRPLNTVYLNMFLCVVSKYISAPLKSSDMLALYK